MSTKLSQPGVTTMLRHFREGETACFWKLVQRYQEPVARWADRRLGRHRAGLNTGEDLAVSVFRDLHDQMDGKRTWLRDMLHTDDFERVLFRLAFIRVCRAVRYEEAEGRCGTVHDQDVTLPGDGSLSAAHAAHDPDPASEAEANLTIEEMKARIRQYDPDPELIRIFELRLEGHTVAEIAGCLGTSTRTIDRGIAALRAILWAWVEEEQHDLEDTRGS